MSWWKYAKPGDKVVCVKKTWGWPCPSPLKQGHVYTIQDLDPHKTTLKSDGSRDTGFCIHLIEAPINPYNKLPLWCCPRFFKPVKSTDKGMSILRGILNGNKITEDA